MDPAIYVFGALLVIAGVVATQKWWHPVYVTYSIIWKVEKTFTAKQITQTAEDMLRMVDRVRQISMDTPDLDVEYVEGGFLKIEIKYPDTIVPEFMQLIRTELASRTSPKQLPEHATGDARDEEVNFWSNSNNTYHTARIAERVIARAYERVALGKAN